MNFWNLAFFTHDTADWRKANLMPAVSWTHVDGFQNHGGSFRPNDGKWWNTTILFAFFVWSWKTRKLPFINKLKLSLVEFSNFIWMTPRAQKPKCKGNVARLKCMLLIKQTSTKYNQNIVSVSMHNGKVIISN